MTSFSQKVEIVRQMYDNDTWRQRVQGMSDAQIIAIYLRFIANPHQPRPATPEELDIELNKSPQGYSELRLF